MALEIYLWGANIRNRPFFWGGIPFTVCLLKRSDVSFLSRNRATSWGTHCWAKSACSKVRMQFSEWFVSNFFQRSWVFRLFVPLFSFLFSIAMSGTTYQTSHENVSCYFPVHDMPKVLHAFPICLSSFVFVILLSLASLKNMLLSYIPYFFSSKLLPLSPCAGQ